MVQIYRQVLIATGARMAGDEIHKQINWLEYSFERVHCALDLRAALRAYDHWQPQLVIIGLDPIHEGGLELYYKVREEGSACAVILLCAQPGLILPDQSGFWQIRTWLEEAGWCLDPEQLALSLSSLLLRLSSAAALQLRQPLSNKELWTARIKELVRQNYTDFDLSITTIAESCNLGAPYAGTVFKQIEGVSLVRYIMSYRCQAAGRLLADPAIRIYEVSRLVGIYDPNYFARCFKKITGLSPKEYRLMVTGRNKCRI